MVDNSKMFDKFSGNVLYMVVFAKAASINAHVDCLYPESFLVGTFLSGENIVTSTLMRNNVDLNLCVKRFKNLLASRQKNNSSKESDICYDEIKISQEIVDICKLADKISTENGHEFIGLGHLFIAIMEFCVDYRLIISDGWEESEQEANYQKCIKEILNDKVNKTTIKSGIKIQSKQKEEDSVFSQYCIDMTAQANNGEFDPIISRDSEIEEAITILCRRNKSNPILIGEPGVGKSAIVEGIAQRIVSNAVPKKLLGCKIYSLNISGMVAGTKYRGDFESRVQDLIKSVENNPKCIIFIDEIHTIVGAGGAGTNMDAANILKPALARKMRCIGATTGQEYKKYFMDDGALSRRFATVTVNEPSDEDVKKILMGIKDRFESYHECKISKEAIDSAIELTKRYRPTKFFPDKAIECIDTACAKFAWQVKDKDNWPIITSDDIAKVVSKQCRIPLEVITWDSKERVRQAEEFLKAKIIGQDHAIKCIVRTLKNAYSGVRNPNKPIGILVFGGQSGTGKTYTAKKMSEAIFGNDSSLIRIDMSEYSEEHSIAKIIGSPPGYVGYKDTNIVIDKIKENPYSILLLDEMEKSHPKVMRLFLQVMSDGSITGANGEKVDCKNIFFIMTGNFGMNTSKNSSMGFASEFKSETESEKERLIDFCKKSYGEEFVNRIDEFVPYMELSQDNLSKIILLRLAEFAERINYKNVKVSIDESVAKYIADKNDKEHGMNAMIVNRTIANEIQPTIADAILDIENINEFNYHLTLKIDKSGNLYVSSRKTKKK